MSPRSCARLVVLQFGPRPAKTSPQGYHAWVGVIGPHGALLSLPTLFDSSFKEFFRLRRAVKVALPLGNGGIAHLFVIFGHQGADSDPEKLALTEHLPASVLGEAKMCCAVQPVVLVGDLNADPSVIPSLAKGLSGGAWIDVEKAFAIGKGVAPVFTCQSRLDEDKGTRWDFTLACPIAFAATTACCVLSDRWFHPHSSIRTDFSLSAGDATVEMARVTSLLWQACWVDRPDRSGRSPSATIQNIWVVFLQELSLVPREVREQLLAACNTTDADASRRIWSGEPVASLARAYLTAGGPALSSLSSFVGGGHLSLRTKRLGGRCRDGIYRMDHADEFDVTNSGFFVNSSLAPVLRFRRRFMSVWKLRLTVF